jgi:hypothetical protein
MPHHPAKIGEGHFVIRCRRAYTYFRPVKFFRIALAFFLWVALVGTAMRLYAVLPMPWPFKFLLHSHSHVGFQGWLSLSAMVLILRFWVRPERRNALVYKFILWATAALVAGIMVSFLLQGYGMYSILFSSLFQVVSYVFIWRVWRDRNSSEGSFYLVKWALIYNALSTLGPWAVGILSAKGYSGTEYYDAAIYFFLHFQYNGWFMLLLPAFLLYFMENNQPATSVLQTKYFMKCLAWSVFPAYALSLLGMEIGVYTEWAAWLSVLMMGFFLLILFYAVPDLYGRFSTVSGRIVLGLGAVSASGFILKHLLQISSIFPVFRTWVFESHSIVIGYLHLVMIGTLSAGLLAVMAATGLFATRSGFFINGIAFLLTGFLLTECLLSFDGLGHTITGHAYFMVAGSIAMVVGVGLLLAAAFENRKGNTQ